MRLLAAGKYEALERDGRSGRVSADELRTAVEDYGRTLVPLPPGAFEVGGDTTSIEHADPPAWFVAQDVWTVEEERSDLTLEMVIYAENGTYRPEIEGLHVL